jgi:hypothetical protein
MNVSGGNRRSDTGKHLRGREARWFGPRSRLADLLILYLSADHLDFSQTSLLSTNTRNRSPGIEPQPARTDTNQLFATLDGIRTVSGVSHIS